MDSLPGERLGRGGRHLATGPGRPATGGTEREHGNRACLAGLQLCPLKNPPRPSCHRDCCPWRCRCKRKAVAVAAPHPALPFPWNAQAKKECWDDAVHESPSKGSRERRLLRPPATSESPSVVPFSAVHAASAVHDWAASLRDSPTNFPAACWATPSASAHHHTKQPSHRPLAMTTFAKLPRSETIAPGQQALSAQLPTGLTSLGNPPGSRLLAIFSGQRGPPRRLQTNTRRDDAHNSEIGSDTKMLLFSPEVEFEHVSDPTSGLGHRRELGRLLPVVSGLTAVSGPAAWPQWTHPVHLASHRPKRPGRWGQVGGRLLETGNGTPRAVSLHPRRRQRATLPSHGRPPLNSALSFRIWGQCRKGTIGLPPSLEVPGAYKASKRPDF